MGNRDNQNKLSDGLEAHEQYYSTGYRQQEDEFTGVKEELKRGKGYLRKTGVLVMAIQRKVTRKVMKNKQLPTYIRPKFIKMKVVENSTIAEISKTAEESIDP